MTYPLPFSFGRSTTFIKYISGTPTNKLTHTFLSSLTYKIFTSELTHIQYVDHFILI